MTRLLVGAVIAGSVLVTAAWTDDAHAAALSGDFEVSVIINDGGDEVARVGPEKGEVGSPVFMSMSVEKSGFNVETLSLDTDGTLKIAVVPSEAASFEYSPTLLTFVLSGLDTRIESVEFDEDATNIKQFNGAAGEFVPPVFANTHDSITVTYGFTGEELASASAMVVSQVTAVPLPAAAWMFAAGVGALALVRRRRGRIQARSAA